MDSKLTGPVESLLELTTGIIAAYVSNNSVPVTDLAALIASVHASLVGLTPSTEAKEADLPKATAQEIRRSVSPDYLISFEDGRQYKTLRRHLTLRGLSPEAYRRKWGLAPDYPMTSRSYSAQRSALAHSLGLGQQRRKSTPSPERRH